MNITLRTALAIGFVTLCATASAQDSTEAARQQHKDARAEDRVRHDGHHVASGSVRQDARNARHSIHQGARETGHAIHQGLRKTGHAIHEGAKATGHAIHRGWDKVTGK